jgi:GNAT superfamily N-acetyltransferase
MASPSDGARWNRVPRTHVSKLPGLSGPGRDEDRDDASVWSVTCFVTRKGYRRLGIGTALARAAPDFARDRGATAVEGYPLLPRADGRVGSGDLYVGTVGMFEAAGFVEVSRPTERRAVMRAEA